MGVIKECIYANLDDCCDMGRGLEEWAMLVEVHILQIPQKKRNNGKNKCEKMYNHAKMIVCNFAYFRAFYRYIFAYYDALFLHI